MDNAQAARAAQIKQTRRGILDALNMVYPGHLTFETICGVFVELEEHYIRRDLQYLCEKNYTQWVNPSRNAAWAMRRYKLTPAGLEVADRINTDPALEP